MTTSAAGQIRRAYPMAILTALLSLPAASTFAAPKPKPKPLVPHWVSSWATANTPLDDTQLQLAVHDTTLRQIIHTTLSGPLLRVELSNEFGTEPLTIGAAHLALAGEQSAILLSSANAMTFHGRESVTIPPGGVAVSDPAAMTFKPGADLAVSLFLPAQKLTHLSAHEDATVTDYRVLGNEVGRSSLRSPAKERAWFFLKSVDVMVPGKNGAVGAFSEGENAKDAKEAKENPQSTQ